MAIGLSVLVGCKKEEVRVYTTPKEQPKSGDRPHIHWRLPSGWEERPLSGMRVGSFRVVGENKEEADISIIPLAGSGGGELENVNRWRSQIGLEPITATQLPEISEKVSIGNAEGSMLDLLGTNQESKKPERMLAATLASGSTTWFFKMTGPDALVSSQKGAFRDFLKFIQFHDASHQDALTGQDGAAPPPASALPVDEPGAPPLPQWEVPSNWQQTPPSMMVLARFAISDGENGRAELRISAFPGDVGGMLANVNRWRREIALAPVGDADLASQTSPIDVNGNKVTLVDLTNPSRKEDVNRILVAVWPHQGQTWFFKLMGNHAVIEKEKAAFLQFIQSVRFPNA